MASLKLGTNCGYREIVDDKEIVIPKSKINYKTIKTSNVSNLGKELRTYGIDENSIKNIIEKFLNNNIILYGSMKILATALFIDFKKIEFNSQVIEKIIKKNIIPFLKKNNEEITQELINNCKKEIFNYHTLVKNCLY